jgi:hypothetical protein
MSLLTSVNRKGGEFEGGAFIGGLVTQAGSYTEQSLRQGEFEGSMPLTSRYEQDLTSGNRSQAGEFEGSMPLTIISTSRILRVRSAHTCNWPLHFGKCYILTQWGQKPLSPLLEKCAKLLATRKTELQRFEAFDFVPLASLMSVE